MKSQVSWFDRGVSRSLLRRFWPLWTGYFVILLLRLPARIPFMISMQNITVHLDGELIPGAALNLLKLESMIASNSSGLLFWSALAGVILAGAMFGHLYNNRMCGLMNSLPIRRETMFCTAYLTGLAPLLIADLLTVLLTALILLPGGYASAQILLKWLAMAVLSNIAFFSFAVFCATLTGHRVHLWLLYLMLNVIVGLLVGCVMLLLSATLYGYSADSFPAWALFLTPPAKLIVGLVNDVIVLAGNDAEADIRLGVIAAYAGMGLLFLVFGFFLYRRRQMETVGDAVAVPWMKPVLKYLFCFGFALGFALLMLVLVGESSSDPSLAALLIFLQLGAFLGYFIAEMLLRRTVKVFRGHWRGFFITAALLAAAAFCLHFDLFGYERYIPAPEAVSAVDFAGSYTAHLESPENIEAVTELHRGALALRDKGDYDTGGYVTITYRLKNGRTVTRQYLLSTELADERDRLCNEPESLVYRFSEACGLRADNIRDASLYVYSSSGTYKSKSDYELSVAEVMDLMENGVRPDAQQGQIGLVNSDEASRYIIIINLKEADGQDRTRVSIPVEKTAENTIRWIENYLQGGTITQELVYTAH